MKQEKWNKLHKELDDALDSEFGKAKLALREYLLENKEKVANDLDEMREKSNQNKMKQTAVEWLEDKIQSDMTFMEVLGLIRQAKAMEKQQGYTYDELRTIAYNAYCLAQLDEPTEGKYNLWIQQYKKNSQTN